MQVKLTLLSLGIGMSLAVSAMAMAQQAPEQGQPPPVAAAAPLNPHVSAQMLDKFKRAFLSVQKIEKEYSAKVQKTHSDKVAIKLRQWAQTRMVSAVKRAGLTVAQFDKVMLLVRRDPTLRNQVLSR